MKTLSSHDPWGFKINWVESHESGRPSKCSTMLLNKRLRQYLIYLGKGKRRNRAENYCWIENCSAGRIFSRSPESGRQSLNSNFLSSTIPPNSPILGFCPQNFSIHVEIVLRTQEKLFNYVCSLNIYPRAAFCYKLQCCIPFTLQEFVEAACMVQNYNWNFSCWNALL